MMTDITHEEAETICIQTAAENGIKAVQARQCDDFNVGCIGCPFAYTARDVKVLKNHIEKRRTTS